MIKIPVYCWELGYEIVVPEMYECWKLYNISCGFTHKLIRFTPHIHMYLSNRSWKRFEADLWWSSFSFQSWPSGVCESGKRSHPGLDHLCSGVAPWRRSNLSSFQGLCPSCPSVLISSLSAAPYETCPVFPSHKSLLPGI